MITLLTARKTKGKSIKVLGIKKGTATITATVGGKKQTCKVSVKNAKKGTVIYNFAKSTNPDNHPPYKADYSEFKYNSFRIWLCDATFWGEKTYISPDYRGRKLKISLKVKNSGKRTLPGDGCLLQLYFRWRHRCLPMGSSCFC